MAQLRDTYVGKYIDVAASQTGTAIQTTGAATGALGDYISSITIIPETTGCGTVALLDGATSVNVFVTGTLEDLSPICIPIHSRATAAAGWSITTGANGHVRVSGRF